MGQSYILEGVFSRIMSENETKALLEMFASDGWKVLMSLKKSDQDASLEVITNMSIPLADPQIDQHRAIYTAIKDDLEIEKRIRDAISNGGRPPE